MHAFIHFSSFIVGSPPKAMPLCWCNVLAQQTLYPSVAPRTRSLAKPYSSRFCVYPEWAGCGEPARELWVSGTWCGSLRFLLELFSLHSELPMAFPQAQPKNHNKHFIFCLSQWAFFFINLPKLASLWKHFQNTLEFETVEKDRLENNMVLDLTW